MTFPFIKQKDAYNCGITCLQMILEYYNKNVLVDEIRRRENEYTFPMSMLDLCSLAKEFELKTKAVRLTFYALKNDLRLPCILHWNKNHYVVLYKIEMNQFFIADPSSGLFNLNGKELKKYWWSNNNSEKEKTGLAIILNPKNRET